MNGEEDMVHKHREYYSAMKTNEICPLAAICMDLEISILSEVRQRQTLYAITYMWSLKK